MDSYTAVNITTSPEIKDFAITVFSKGAAKDIKMGLGFSITLQDDKILRVILRDTDSVNTLIDSLKNYRDQIWVPQN